MERRNSTYNIEKAAVAQRVLASTTEEMRSQMLLAIAEGLQQQSDFLFEANTQDIEKAQQEHIPYPLQKRLTFNQKKLDEVVDGILQVARLEDPIGKVRERRLLDDELLLERIDVPIGVIGMIFESRPDALVQIVSLCLKSGNAIVLKGGSEALHTNRALVSVIAESLAPFPVGSDWMVLLESREDVMTMITLDHLIDLLIPRGSNEFVRFIMANSRIPVLGHADGLCTIYVDKYADVQKAVRIAVDSKCQYPAVCNAVETVLVHKEIAPSFVPAFAKALEPYNVIIHGDEHVCALISCTKAVDADWDTEYLDYELALGIVDDVHQAIEHIALHGSSHTDCIISEHNDTAREFLKRVDSADVFWNCSTRFADGFRYGLGAEVGISTQKVHARGPVGLQGLVIGKWILKGNGHIVADYSNENSFKHISLNPGGSSIIEGDTI